MSDADAIIAAVGSLLKSGDEAKLLGRNGANLIETGSNTLKRADDALDEAEDIAKAGKVPNNTKPYANSRPSYGKTQVEDVWNAKVDPQTGKVLDPSGANITWDRTIPRKGQWDMGHIPGEKYSGIHGQYMRGEISQKDFLAWYKNPANYRPELPSTNRSHKFEK